MLVRYLGESIAAARKEKGMSAVKLSEATAAIGMGVHRVAIPRIEKGEQVVTVPELIALGIALDADWSLWLMDATESADIGDTRSARMQLEAAMQELEREIAAVTKQAESASRDLQSQTAMPERIRKLREVDLAGYETLLNSLLSQRVFLQQEIRANRLGRRARSEAIDDE